MSQETTKIKSELIITDNENFETVPLIKTNNSNMGEKLTLEQKKLLKGYKDKSLIVAILASLTGEQMKIPNIIINSVTGLTLAMISNFKITEKVTVFQNVAAKMNKLNHRIEEAMINNDESLNKDKMSMFIKEYEALVESLDYPFPTSIKKKVYAKYKDSGLKLPNALIGFDDIGITDLNANNFNGLDSV